MKKLLVILASLVLSTGFSFAKEVTKKDIQLIKESFPMVFGNEGIIINKTVDFDNLKLLDITIQGRAMTVFYSKIDKKLIFGNVIDTDGQKLEAPKNTKIIKNGIINSYGSGKKDIYIVTDLECPYCKRLENNLDENIYKEYTIHTIFMPLSFHKNAMDMSLWVIAGTTKKERHQRISKALKGDMAYKTFKPKNKKELEKKLKLSIRAAKELKAQGTPAVYDENFNSINYQILLKKK
ncbi:thiol:disulfide interchange protein, putative [hydrothermal vent metagenome]|uniref:Thiol:disulfide interchange protein, putative n=1 Tax=hydrothermal vent metagenome TaxID=652676 RepID=A0A3B1E7A4_9ZZZZ